MIFMLHPNPPLLWRGLLNNIVYKIANQNSLLWRGQGEAKRHSNQRNLKPKKAPTCPAK
jgi:hypothetical protein